MNSSRILSIAMVWIICGCSSEKGPREYMKWIEDPGNGFTKRLTLKNGELNLSFLPPQYLALKTFNQPDKIDSTTFEMELRKKKNSRIVKITCKNDFFKSIGISDPFAAERWLKDNLSYTSEGCGILKPRYIFSEEGNLMVGIESYLAVFPVCDNKPFGSMQINFKDDLDKGHALIITEEMIKNVPKIKFKFKA